MVSSAFTILATKKEHVKASIDFARNNHVCLIIGNTGHDFMDRSTGYGSLAINAHSFKDVTFHANYTRPGWYSGPAVTVAAGIQGRELGYRERKNGVGSV
ncbi:FAD binding domain-containing protein [Coprinopsis cinerea AmutBmut pab1-1]|nr:FAD binding domain-containing protein [Coprinopsis cinerea AmutBmut pab1-1]